ncbi:MAG: hypothetical protein U9O59_01870, partial [Actinomycetota bacterium]|nr:hypothetical protein [Actinomycetota bacterium]
MKREEGYYWVNRYGDWEIAEWFIDMNGVGRWLVLGMIEKVNDNFWAKIDERRILRHPSTTEELIKEIERWRQ